MNLDKTMCLSANIVSGEPGRVIEVSTNLNGVLSSKFPLVVDLDGTLMRTDMLHESALVVVRDNCTYPLLDYAGL